MWRRSTVAFSFTFDGVTPEILSKAVSSRLQRICREERLLFFILSSDELFKKIRRKVHRKCVILDSYDLCGALCVYLLNFSDVSPSQSSMRSKSIAFSDAMSFRRHLNIKWTQTLCSLFLRMPNANTHIITF